MHRLTEKSLCKPLVPLYHFLFVIHCSSNSFSPNTQAPNRQVDLVCPTYRVLTITLPAEPGGQWRILFFWFNLGSNASCASNSSSRASLSIAQCMSPPFLLRDSNPGVVCSCSWPGMTFHLKAWFALTSITSKVTANSHAGLAIPLSILLLLKKKVIHFCQTQVEESSAKCDSTRVRYILLDATLSVVQWCILLYAIGTLLLLLLVLVECMGRQSSCRYFFSVYDVAWTGAAMFS